MYLDWGLEISYNDETLYYNPIVFLLIV